MSTGLARVLSQACWTVTSKMCIPLLAPFTCIELHDALRTLSRDIFLGKDGLLPALHFEIVGPCGRGVAACFQEVMDRGALSESVTNGLIFLIPKGRGDLEEVHLWRPIGS